MPPTNTPISLPSPCDPTPSADQPLPVLVFSKTAGFRHESIENGVRALQAIAETRGWTLTPTEDESVFTDANLAAYRVIVFLNTSGTILDAAQRAAFEAYMGAGGGWVGIHAASDTEHEWAWYGGLVGAYFVNHPSGMPEATIHVEDPTHPATQVLPDPWVRSDEWYNYHRNPRENVHVLLALDETSYSGGTMGDHPLAWAHEYGGGRAIYTGVGHDPAHFDDPLVRAHLAGAVEWAACG